MRITDINFSKIQEEFEAIKNNHNELVTTQTSKRVDEIIQPVVEENVKKHTEKVINELSDKVVIVDSKIEEVEEIVKTVKAHIGIAKTKEEVEEILKRYEILDKKSGKLVTE